MDGWMDGWIDGWMDGQTSLVDSPRKTVILGRPSTKTGIIGGLSTLDRRP